LSNDFYTTSILPHAGIIIKICRAYTNAQEDFEDAYQEVCLQIWKSRTNFKDESKWSTWIYRITLNVCLTLIKKKNRKLHVLVDVPNSHSSEANTAFADESLNLLYDAIKKLKEIDRMVILMYLEEKPYKEIAQVVGATPNNIAVRITRIKKQLKKILDGKIN
jgi:RNA polymerase sigma-70 factor (ECF subfamily)